MDSYNLHCYLNGKMNIHFLKNYLLNWLENLPSEIGRAIRYQYNWGRVHFSLGDRNHLDNILSNRLVGRETVFPSPARSPDLTLVYRKDWKIYFKHFLPRQRICWFNPKCDKLYLKCWDQLHCYENQLNNNALHFQTNGKHDVHLKPEYTFL